jgi:hypothetical protein
MSPRLSHHFAEAPQPGCEWAKGVMGQCGGDAIITLSIIPGSCPRRPRDALLAKDQWIGALNPSSNSAGPRRTGPISPARRPVQQQYPNPKLCHCCCHLLLMRSPALLHQSGWCWVGSCGLCWECCAEGCQKFQCGWRPTAIL